MRNSFGDRTSILSIADRVVSLAQSEAQLRNSDQTSMFDMFGESVQAPLTEIEIEEGYTTETQKGEWELELLGVNLSSKDALAVIAEIENSTQQDSHSLNKRLLITIIESKKVETDRVLLNNLIRELLEHNGNDDVEMEVKTPNSVVKLAWPLIKVKATTELAEYVAEMLGDSGHVALVEH